jgi:hypothetical protein
MNKTLEELKVMNIELIIILVVGLLVIYLLKRLFDYSASRLPANQPPGFHFPGPISLIIVGLLFVAFVVFFMFIPIYFSHVFPGCRFLINLQSESPLNLLLILIGTVTIAWFSARFQEDIWTYNGFGTTMYVSNNELDRTRIGTKWLVVLLVPILPVRSFQVLGERKVSWDQTEYVTESLDSMRWDHVMDTVRSRWWIYGLVVLGIVVVTAFSVIPCVCEATNLC